MNDPNLHVLILAGGIGSRFWPASTPSVPKQLLPLAGDDPLVVDTVRRARALAPAERVHILTGAHLVDPIRSVLPAEFSDAFLVEPRARGTGPVLAWAAWELARRNPDALLVSLHSDHVVEPEEELIQTLSAAATVAREHDRLVTISATPDRPETGYGYIRPGSPLPLPDPAPVEAFQVEAFVEKPDRERAREYVDQGYLWNTGIFVWTARRFLDELRLHAPEVGDHLPLLASGAMEDFFHTVPPISVDESVLERSGRVASVRATFRWDDVGSWEALARSRGTDASGNVTVGDVHPVESKGNVVYSRGGPVVLFGVEDLLVVRTRGVTFVTPRSRGGDLKALLQRLPPELRDPEGNSE